MKKKTINNHNLKKKFISSSIKNFKINCNHLIIFNYFQHYNNILDKESLI